MNNKKAKKLIDDIFNKISESKTLENLSDILDKNPLLKKNKMNERVYPDLKLILSPNEIDAMKEAEILDDAGMLSENLSGTQLSPLEKLLYAILWKNGDLRKEIHVVEGVKSVANNGTEINRAKGLVFYQFGKHLANRTEPIVDQHVLRAYALYCNDVAGEDFSKYRSKGVINKSDSILISKYKEWLVSESLTTELKKIEGYTFCIDKILFSLGKVVKTKKYSNKK